MKAKDVFTPTGLPSVTFVRAHLQQRATTLQNAIETGGLLISLVGPSKSGKTVFIEEIIGKSRLVHVTGAGIKEPAQLWNRVFDIIGTPIENRTAETVSSQQTIGGKITGGLDAFVAKAGGEASTSLQKQQTTMDSTLKAIDHLQLLIRELKSTDLVVFIDDFHYIKKETQPAIAEQIKEAVRQGLSIITAAVPFHSDDVVRSNLDLSGRITKLDFDYWKKDQLLEISRLGFEALNLQCPIELADRFAEEAAGSPQLMQALCLNACYASNNRESASVLTSLPGDKSFLAQVCDQTALMTDFASSVSKMKEGPKTRGKDRTNHALVDGSVSDVYPIVVRAIALDPPRLNFRYTELKERINKVCPMSGPSGSGITGACEHIAKLANETSGSALLEWDGSQDVLDIRDPYLLFYLRWGDK